MKPIFFFLVVIISISVSNLIIIFAEPNNKIIYSSWILIINSFIAAVLSIFILLKDKGNKDRDRTIIHLAIGLVFWFIANVIWGYYEIALDVVSPVPSLADFFLLAAYAFLIYRLIVTYIKIDRKVNKKILFLIIFSTALFLLYIINLTIDVSELSSFRGFMLFVVTIAYPVLNSILMVFALLILIELKSDKHHSIAWITELVGLLAIVVGDSWFAIIVLTSFVEQLWISSLLLSAHYLLIAGGLVWYMRHAVKWQSKNIFDNIIKRTRNRIPKKVLIGLLLIATISIILSVYSTNVFSNDNSNYFINKKSFDIQSSFDKAAGKKEFVIGAIMPFTGSLSSIGKSVKVALNKAEEDANHYFQEMNSPYRFNILMADSKTSPEDSLVAIKKLHENGANIIVGPATSTAVSAVRDYADTNNIILISYASTSPLLSIKGDNLFRLVPDDTNQGKTVAEKMIKDGIKVIVPFWRDDIYGNELYNSTKSNFIKLGGKVQDGITYEPHTGRFATSLHRINFIMWDQQLKKLNTIVSDAIKRYGVKAVAVYIISYDEIAPILIQAQNYDILKKVRWYGSDSIAQSSQITKNWDAADFAMKTNFTNPLFSINNNINLEKIKSLEEDLKKELHEVGSITYPVIAYDSYWVASLSLYKNSTLIYDKNSNINTITKSFKQIVFDTSNKPLEEGLSGKITLNSAGDRVSDSYDFWIVNKNSHGYEWDKVNSTIMH
ncbi:MAG: ABC transporter substrate-binding protein [Candidatus Nitrosocosmicus sp.]